MTRHASATSGRRWRGAEMEHGQALDQEYTTDEGREALLNRLCIDGGTTAAFSLRCLHAESPRLADPVLEHFARYADEIDELVLSLGDAAVRARERGEAA